MSVFALNPKRIGGIEMFARELSFQLSEYGWESILCFAAEPPENVRRFLSLPNVSIQALPSVVQTGWRAFSWRAFSKISEVLSIRRPEILHMHFTPQLSFYPWLARLRSVRRYYLTDHSSRSEGSVPARAPKWKQLIGAALNKPVTNLVAVSDSNAHADRLGGLIRPNRVVRIYNGVDLSRGPGDAALFRKRYNIPNDRSVVLQVSWMIPEKGVEDLLAAARIVLGEYPEVQFVMAGEGPARQQFMAEADLAGMSSHFTWTGLVEDPLDSGLYAAADVFCQLSRWEEAFGWTNTEAMVCGKPVVAARVGGVPEIVTDGVSGFLVERRRPAEAADRILRLLRDPNLRQRLGATGRRVVESKFDLRRNVAELIDLYGVASRDVATRRAHAEATAASR
jgi:glycosyltransferase involved in cell wall biosynthesis